MIKDKITPDIKKKFRELIQTSIKTGKEHGLLLCIDENEKLSTTKSCEGEQCGIKFVDVKCPTGTLTQGYFHTHPYISSIRETTKKHFPKEKITDKFIKSIVLKGMKEKEVFPFVPSHSDLLVAVIRKYRRETLGTTCVGNDVNPNIVECWTVKHDVDKKDYDKAVSEIHTPVAENYPQEWIKPLFDTERIYLDKRYMKK